MHAPTLELDPAADRAAANRAAINQTNAKHSTGPRTPEGKQRIRLNALKHGLSAQTVLLPSEDAAAYEALGASLTSQYQPATEQQARLVLTLQDALWRLDRIPALIHNLNTVALEEALAKLEYSGGPREDRARAEVHAFRANARHLEQLARHESRIRRIVQQTEAVLDAVTSDRLETELLTALAAPKLPCPQVGFELSDVHAAAPKTKFRMPQPTLTRRRRKELARERREALTSGQVSQLPR